MKGLIYRWTDSFAAERTCTRVVQTAKVCYVCSLYCGGGSIPIPNPNFFPELQHGVRSCPRLARHRLSSLSRPLSHYEAGPKERTCPPPQSMPGSGLECARYRARVVWTHF